MFYLVEGKQSSTSNKIFFFFVTQMWSQTRNQFYKSSDVIQALQLFALTDNNLTRLKHLDFWDLSTTNNFFFLCHSDLLLPWRLFHLLTTCLSYNSDFWILKFGPVLIGKTDQFHLHWKSYHHKIVFVNLATQLLTSYVVVELWSADENSTAIFLTTIFCVTLKWLIQLAQQLKLRIPKREAKNLPFPWISIPLFLVILNHCINAWTFSCHDSCSFFCFKTLADFDSPFFSLHVIAPFSSMVNALRHCDVNLCTKH